jgi:pimeloyl-ACP methyl ester carboxylesterase
MTANPVNQIGLAYETMGAGPPLILTPGVFMPRDSWTYLQAGHFCANYQVLLWDRPNTGASDLAIEATPSEWHLWAEKLHQLLEALDMSPAILVGGSAGSVFSLLMAHLYPDDVVGLVLNNPPTDQPQVIQAIAYARYALLAEAVECGGMQAAIDLSNQAWIRLITSPPDPTSLDALTKWVAESLASNPGNRQALLAMEPKAFASALRQWGNWCDPEGFFRAGLSPEEMGNLNIPALVLPGFDDLHPQHTAEMLHSTLPQSVWVDYSDWYPPELTEAVKRSPDLATQKAFLNLPIVENFLGRITGVS